MPPRWNWRFDDHEPTGPLSTGGPPASAQERARRVQIRRRRAAAAVLLVLLALLAVAVAVAPGSKSSSHPPRTASGAVGARARRTQTRAAHAPEQSPSAAVEAVLAYTPFVKEGGDRGRDVALTFDDGPGPYTPGVLSVLERFHVHATFFEIGEMLRYFSASTERELRDGDVIGDHTETHPEMATLSAHAQHEELFEQILHIELAGGPRPLLFRPPYGSYDATTMRELRSLHLLMVLWSDDTEDYLQPGVSAIVQRALAGAHPGAIILMHDAGGDRSETIAALPQIVAGLRKRGLKPVTVPQLLKDDPPPHGQPIPTALSGG
jgi:peptidoglycan/xylan/chitin deacetylase (PgdA/CDA1 family)